MLTIDAPSWHAWSMTGGAARVEPVDVDGLDVVFGGPLVSAWRHWSRHPWLVDAVLLTPPVIHDVVDPNSRHPLPLLLAAGLVLPCLWRRRFPVAVFAVLALVAFAQWFTGVGLLCDVALLYAAYAVARQRPASYTAATVVVLEVGAALAASRWSDGQVWKLFLLVSAAVLAAVSLGHAARIRAAYLVARATAQADATELARAAERERIGRDVHDIVAHNLSVMIALVDGAASAQQTAPARTAEALHQAGVTGRRALRELRATLVDTDPTEESPGARQPTPGLTDVDDLVRHVRSTGRAVAVIRRGRRGDRFPAAVELAAYRIVQEALTNVVKHAAPEAAVEVLLEQSEDRLEVSVTDSGPRWEQAATTFPLGGRGMGGMQERAAACGGSLAAGPCGAGWRVSAAFAVSEIGS